MFVFFHGIIWTESDSDTPLHMSIQFQGYYVWLVCKRSCYNYSDLCSDNRIYSKIKMMSGLSNFSKYIWKEEKALFSRTKQKVHCTTWSICYWWLSFLDYPWKGFISTGNCRVPSLAFKNQKVFVLVLMWQQISDTMILVNTLLFNQTFGLRPYAKHRSRWRKVRSRE